MPTPPKSTYRRAVEQVKTLLGGIVAGGDYFYTPSAVLLVPVYSADWLHRTKDVIYMIRPGSENTTDFSSTNEAEGDAEVFILAAKKYEPATENPYEVTSPDRWETQDRLDRDIRKRLGTDPGLACIVDWARVTDTFRDDELILEGWAAVELRIGFHYAFLLTEP